MKNTKITALAASVIAAIGLFLSCSIDPYGEGPGGNSKGGDTSILVQNIEIGGGSGGGGGGGGGGCTKPSAPKNVVCTANWWNEIGISWSSVSGATSYEVYHSKSANGTYEYVGSTTTTSYKEGWLDGSTTYYYRIKAVNSCGTSSFSEYGYAKTGLFG